MYCSHCGYNLNEKKVEKLTQNDPNRTKDSTETFVCPRCGKIIKPDLNNEEVKGLARASHSEIHRARNSLNSGMCFLMIAIILLSISGMFYLMSFKASAGGQLVTTSNEFYVFIGLLVLGLISLGYSIYRLVIGILKHRRYSKLLKDIQNDVFKQ